MSKNKSTINHNPNMKDGKQQGKKVLMIGDANVGKTCILHRFIFNEFLKKSQTTLCGGVKIKNVGFTNEQ